MPLPQIPIKKPIPTQPVQPNNQPNQNPVENQAKPLPYKAIGWTPKGEPYYGAGLDGWWRKITAQALDVTKIFGTTKAIDPNEPSKMIPALEAYGAKFNRPVLKPGEVLNKKQIEASESDTRKQLGNIDPVEWGKMITSDPGSILRAGGSVLKTGLFGLLDMLNLPQIGVRKLVSAGVAEYVAQNDAWKYPSKSLSDIKNSIMNGSNMVYSVWLNSAKREQALRDMLSGMPALYAEEKYSNAVIEMAGSIVLDPMWFVPAPHLGWLNEAKDTGVISKALGESLEQGARLIEQGGREMLVGDEAARLVKNVREAIGVVEAKRVANASTRNIFSLITDAKRMVSFSRIKEVFGHIINMEAKDAESIGEVVSLIVRAASGDEAEAAHAIMSLYSKPYSHVLFSNAGLETQMFLTKMTEGNLPKFLSKITEIAGKNDLVKMTEFVTSKLESVVKDFYPSIDDMAAAAEKIKNMGSVAEKVTEVAGVTGVKTEKAIESVSKLQNLADLYEQVKPFQKTMNHINNTLQHHVILGKYGIADINRFFAGIYMGMSPAYAMRNMFNNTFTIFADAGARTAAKSFKFGLKGYFKGFFGNDLSFIDKTVKDLEQRGVTLEYTRALSGIGMAGEKVPTKNLTLAQKVLEPGLRMAQLEEKAQSVAIWGDTFVREMERSYRQGLVPDMRKMVDAGMSKETANFLATLFYKKKMNVKTTMDAFRETLQGGKVEVWKNMPLDPWVHNLLSNKLIDGENEFHEICDLATSKEDLAIKLDTWFNSLVKRIVKGASGKGMAVPNTPEARAIIDGAEELVGRGLNQGDVSILGELVNAEQKSRITMTNATIQIRERLLQDNRGRVPEEIFNATRQDLLEINGARSTNMHDAWNDFRDAIHAISENTHTDSNLEEITKGIESAINKLSEHFENPAIKSTYKMPTLDYSSVQSFKNSMWDWYRKEFGSKYWLDFTYDTSGQLFEKALKPVFDSLGIPMDSTTDLANYLIKQKPWGESLARELLERQNMLDNLAGVGENAGKGIAKAATVEEYRGVHLWADRYVVPSQIRDTKRGELSRFVYALTGEKEPSKLYNNVKQFLIDYGVEDEAGLTKLFYDMNAGTAGEKAGATLYNAKMETNARAAIENFKNVEPELYDQIDTVLNRQKFPRPAVSTDMENIGKSIKIEVNRLAKTPDQNGVLWIIKKEGYKAKKSEFKISEAEKALGIVEKRFTTPEKGKGLQDALNQIPSEARKFVSDIYKKKWEDKLVRAGKNIAMPLNRSRAVDQMKDTFHLTQQQADYAATLLDNFEEWVGFPKGSLYQDYIEGYIKGGKAGLFQGTRLDAEGVAKEISSWGVKNPITNYDTVIGNVKIRVDYVPEIKSGNVTSESHLRISDLNTMEFARNQGEGGEVLDNIIKLSDENGVRVELDAVAYERGAKKSISQNKLIKWYEKHGFVKQSGGHMIHNPPNRLEDLAKEYGTAALYQQGKNVPEYLSPEAINNLLNSTKMQTRDGLEKFIREGAIDGYERISILDAAYKTGGEKQQWAIEISKKYLKSDPENFLNMEPGKWLSLKQEGKTLPQDLTKLGLNNAVVEKMDGMPILRDAKDMPASYPLRHSYDITWREITKTEAGRDITTEGRYLWSKKIVMEKGTPVASRNWAGAPYSENLERILKPDVFQPRMTVTQDLDSAGNLLNKWSATVEGTGNFILGEERKTWKIVSRKSFDSFSDAQRWAEHVYEKIPSSPFDDILLGQGTKAGISWTDQFKAVIHSFKGGDISSVVHEHSHMYIEVMKDVVNKTADPYLTRKLDVLEKWAGVKNGEWLTENHERVARGFEHYMRTGKAPNMEMENIFAAMKRWLTDIYNKIKGSDIDVKLTPEIKSLFDEWTSGERVLGPGLEDLAKPVEKKIVRTGNPLQDAIETLTEHTKEPDMATILHDKYIPPPETGPMSAPDGLRQQIENAIPAIKMEINKRVNAYGQTENIFTNPDIERELADWTKKLSERTSQANFHAARIADLTRDHALLNYEGKTYFDKALAYIMPFHFWYGRTYPNWLGRLVEHPQIPLDYARYRHALEIAHAGMPDWWKYNISTNDLPGMNSDNPYYFNLESSINPLNGLTGVDFNDPNKRINWWTKAIDDLGKFGPTLWTPINWIVAGALYSQGENDAAVRWAGRLIPQTTMLKSMAYKLGVKMPLVRNNELDPFVQAFSGGIDPYEQRRVGRALGTLVENGDVSPEAAQEAAYSRKGEVWEKALALSQDKRAAGNLVSFFMGTGFKKRDQSDLQIDEFYSAYYNLWNMKDNLHPDEFADGMLELRKRYPFMDTLLISRKPTDDRDGALTYSILSRIPPGQKTELAKDAGIDNLMNQFYNSKGDFTKWSKSDHDRFMTGIIDIGAVLAVPDNAVATEYSSASRGYKNMMTQMDAKFGKGIQGMVDGYYQLQGAERQGYLDLNPVVRQALSWKSEFILTHNILNKYYGGISVLEQYYTSQMYDILGKEFDYPQIQATWKKYDELNITDTKAASKFKKAHPELTTYTNRQNELRDNIYRVIAQLASKFPDAPQVPVRNDIVDLSTQQKEIQGAVQPQPTLGWDDWQMLLSPSMQSVILDYYQNGTKLPYAVSGQLDYVAKSVGMYDGKEVLQQILIAIQKAQNGKK